jgi:uracil-DNA glycosylase
MNAGVSHRGRAASGARTGAEGLAQLAAQATACERCPLFADATQVVFGEGPVDAALMLVGEQPGDQEDRAGRPFVGPAGRILDEALAQAGLDRRRIYVTNAVKHFKHEQRGKRRLHKKPNVSEIDICRWWLERELSVVAPKLVVALGATAARALSGRNLVLSHYRGQTLLFGEKTAGLVTRHPSAILRLQDKVVRQQAFAEFAQDMRLARHLIENGKLPGA